jgi:hypothetical protein
MVRAPPVETGGHLEQPACLQHGRGGGGADAALSGLAPRRRGGAKPLRVVKRELAQRTWRHVQDYADAKTAVVNEILAAAEGAPDPSQ